MAFKLLHLFQLVLNIRPDPNRHVAATGRELAPIRREGNRQDPAFMTLEHLHLLKPALLIRRPDPDSVVVATRREPVPVR